MYVIEDDTKFDVAYHKYHKFMAWMYNKLKGDTVNCEFEDFVCWLNKKWHNYKPEKAKNRNPKQFIYWQCRAFLHEVQRINEKLFQLKLYGKDPEKIQQRQLLRIYKYTEEYDIYDELVEALERLPERWLDMMAMFFEGSKTTEIADKYGISHERVRQLIIKAIVKLRSIMNPRLVDDPVYLKEFW
jgi:RNA polymerase sigma factor (sigma-70 family)